MPSAEWFEESNRPINHMANKSQRRAHGTVRRIMDKWADVQFLRNGVWLDAQTVRIEPRSGVQFAADLGTGNAVTFIERCTVFGVRDHAVLPDLDAKIGDHFGYKDNIYIVIEVTDHAGERQLTCNRWQP